MTDRTDIADAHVDDAAPTSLAEALHDAARIEALGDLVAERRAQIRAYIDEQLRAISRDTGGAPRISNKGVAQAYITDPAPTLQIHARDDYEAWLRAKLPNAIRGIEQIRVEKVREILAADEVLAKLFREQGALVTEWVTDEALPAMLGEWPRADDGRIIDPDGEPVAGVRMTERAGTLVVKIDKGFRERLADAARGRAAELATRGAS